MRKTLACALMIPLLLLTGCGQREAKLSKDFAAFRESLAAAQTVEAALSLHVDMGETVAEYELSVSSDADGCTVTVIEPALIAGVQARFDALGTELSYDGVRLSVGAIAGLTPVTASPAMLRAMRWGYEELLWREDGCVAARLWMEDGAVMTLWLSEENIPLCAEIMDENGAAVMTATFRNWTMT